MIESSHLVFPTPNIEKTANYYASVLGFSRVDYLSCSEPHICLYRDKVEVILTKANCAVKPNRKQYGYGYDAYFITQEQECLQSNFLMHGAKIVQSLCLTDYQNKEFVVEDCDGRWLAFGVKQKETCGALASKNLYLIGGTMGVGKTSACQALKEMLPDSVFLDGDWCWDSDPFKATDETKAMVIDNICYLLNNFLRCSAYRNIIFCWVMHEQSIIDEIMQRLNLSDTTSVKTVSLVCSPEVLMARLKKDVDLGKREADIIDRSVSRLPLYNLLDTCKIDTSNLDIREVAERIARA